MDFYRHDKTADYLPLIDGIYNWTRHFVWTRNEFADVPSSPFAIGGTLSAAFLVDYYYAFKDDPERAARARQALDLARNITYRYLIAWACDNDHDDNLDSSFLWEPNSGRDWVGTACANELHWNLDTLTQIYVNCGDPILNYYLRGALARWHLLYKDLPADAISEYGADALSEWLGLFDGTMAGRGGRAAFGTGDILPLHYPVGKSVLSVTCGRKAALECSKGGVDWWIEDYRYTPDANFAFTVRSRRPGAFDATVSFPFADLTDQPVTVTRGKAVRPLAPGKDLLRSPDAPSYVYVRGLEDGDMLSVGRLAADAPSCPWATRGRYGRPAIGSWPKGRSKCSACRPASGCPMPGTIRLPSPASGRGGTGPGVCRSTCRRPRRMPRRWPSRGRVRFTCLPARRPSTCSSPPTTRRAGCGSSSRGSLRQASRRPTVQSPGGPGPLVSIEESSWPASRRPARASSASFRRVANWWPSRF